MSKPLCVTNKCLEETGGVHEVFEVKRVYTLNNFSIEDWVIMQHIRVVRTTFRHYGRRNVVPIHSEEWGNFLCVPAEEVEDETMTVRDIAVRFLEESDVKPSYHVFQKDLHYLAPNVDENGNGDVDFYCLEEFSMEEQQEIFERIIGTNI